MLIRFFLLLVILPLAACQTADLVPGGEYVLPDRPGGRMCILACRKALDSCREGCKLAYRACYIDMQRQALNDFEAYSQAQFRIHQPADLWPRDFERPEKCESKTCLGRCTPPYHLCYEQCGGEVIGHPTPEVSPF